MNLRSLLQSVRARLAPRRTVACSAGRRLVPGYTGPLSRIQLADGQVVDHYGDGPIPRDARVLLIYDQTGGGNGLSFTPAARGG